MSTQTATKETGGLSDLDHRIKQAQHDFLCSCGATEQRVKWRTMRELIVRRSNQQRTEKGSCEY